MRPQIGLVLGGGGSRGFAHIGVLKVLAEASIPIDYIVGTSMGAIVGIAYASGLSADELIQRVHDLASTNFFNIRLITPEARRDMLKEILEQLYGEKTFDDLHIPACVMAVDAVTGREIKMVEGLLVPAVLASSAVPAAFAPVKYHNMQLVDGGVIDSLAIYPAREAGMDRIIAVDIYPPLEEKNIWVDPLLSAFGFSLPFLGRSRDHSPSFAAATWRAYRIMTWTLHQNRLEVHPPDILLRPDVEDVGVFDFKNIDETITRGEVCTRKQIETIQSWLA